jgi:hypothetical protein
MFFRIALAIVLLVLPAAAAETWLSVAEMRSVFTGQTVTGMYFWRVVYTETYHADGSITYWDPSNGAVTGRWHFSGQGFCTFYDSIISGGCFTLRKVGDNCYENYMIEAQDTGPLKPEDTKPYVSQFWLNTAPATCEDKMS